MIATRNNMQLARDENPDAKIVMFDSADGEFSAEPDDYFMLGLDETIRDETGEACSLGLWMPGQYAAIDSNGKVL